ncbi:hypothetical protein GV827_00865 [Sulfitobacter sp. JBTF-M27]|jgi:hypothetical protein|uniref:Heme exporter protein D n=1 Tax=Sulfitobacter sediminilitoris TaxID=2698830 RepID=A0A6P0C479_9RHOB|nr:hypothetical protein [Sulfitobacter sediminilitoris]NEK20952.1 hypothetical protein [Sulfitobacter sediminilitoris]
MFSEFATVIGCLSLVLLTLMALSARDARVMRIKAKVRHPQKLPRK